MDDELILAEYLNQNFENLPLEIAKIVQKIIDRNTKHTQERFEKGFNQGLKNG